MTNRVFFHTADDGRDPWLIAMSQMVSGEIDPQETEYFQVECLAVGCGRLAIRTLLDGVPHIECGEHAVELELHGEDCDYEPEAECAKCGGEGGTDKGACDCWRPEYEPIDPRDFDFVRDKFVEQWCDYVK